MKDVLKAEIERLDALTDNVSWFINEAGNGAIGMGKGFAYALHTYPDGTVSSSETWTGEWFSGIVV